MIRAGAERHSCRRSAAESEICCVAPRSAASQRGYCVMRASEKPRCVELRLWGPKGNQCKCKTAAWVCQADVVVMQEAGSRKMPQHVNLLLGALFSQQKLELE